MTGSPACADALFTLRNVWARFSIRCHQDTPLATSKNESLGIDSLSKVLLISLGSEEVTSVSHFAELLIDLAE